MTSQSPFFPRMLVGVAVAIMSIGVALAVARADDSGSVSGTVRDWLSGAAIAGAAVSITDDFAPTSVHVATDRSGGFAAVGLEPGRYTALFSKDGMMTAVSSFDVCPGAQTPMKVIMRDSPRSCSRNCVDIPRQPRATIFSTSSTTVLFTQWSGTPPLRCM